MNNYSSAQKIAITFGILLLILLAGEAVNHIIIGNARQVKLANTKPLVGQATQLVISNDSSNISNTSNYNLTDTHLFDSNTWAVAKLIPPSSTGGDNSTVVMQRVGQFYQVVVGPGTAFPSNITVGLPADVSSYLQNNGLVLNEEQ